MWFVVFHRSEILCYRRTVAWSRSSPVSTLLSQTARMFWTQMSSKPNVLPVFFCVEHRIFFHREPPPRIQTTIQRVSHCYSRVIVTCGSTPTTSIPGACSLFLSFAKMMVAVCWIVCIFLYRNLYQNQIQNRFLLHLCAIILHHFSPKKTTLCFTPREFISIPSNRDLNRLIWIHWFFLHLVVRGTLRRYFITY